MISLASYSFMLIAAVGLLSVATDWLLNIRLRHARDWMRDAASRNFDASRFALFTLITGGQLLIMSGLANREFGRYAETCAGLYAYALLLICLFAVFAAFTAALWRFTERERLASLYDKMRELSQRNSELIRCKADLDKARVELRLLQREFVAPQFEADTEADWVKLREAYELGALAKPDGSPVNISYFNKQVLTCDGAEKGENQAVYAPLGSLLKVCKTTVKPPSYRRKAAGEFELKRNANY